MPTLQRIAIRLANYANSKSLTLEEIQHVTHIPGNRVEKALEIPPDVTRRLVGSTLYLRRGTEFADVYRDQHGWNCGGAETY